MQAPWSHVVAVACHKLWRLPVFSVIKSNHMLRRQVMAAAAASGTASVMGSPVGALVFSLEVTASYFLVRCVAAPRRAQCRDVQCV